MTSDVAPTRRVALVTCAELPHGDADDDGIIAALAEVGIEASWQVWDDPSVSWPRFDAVVLRSPWDYTGRRGEFLAWAESIPARGPMLLNPAELLQWSSDKRYLRDIAVAGIPIVPTRWIEPHDTVSDWSEFEAEFVLKPSVGAGSLGAGRFTSAETVAASQHLRTLQDAGRTVMAQPYLSQVDELGERALLYFDGEFSHAITKAALLPPQARYELRKGSSRQSDAALFVAEHISAAQADESERTVAARVRDYVTARFGQTPLYLRVDLLPTSDSPVVIEVELVEPSLFFHFSDGAAARFAAALAGRLEGSVGRTNDCADVD